MLRNENLKYAFCEDWFIYATDENSKLYYIVTEFWPEWSDLPENADQEPNAIEKHMLPIAIKNWNKLRFRKTDSYIK